MLPGMEDLSYKERLNRLGYFSLEHRRLRDNFIDVYKIMTGLEAASRTHLVAEAADEADHHVRSLEFQARRCHRSSLKKSQAGNISSLGMPLARVVGILAGLTIKDAEGAKADYHAAGCGHNGHEEQAILPSPLLKPPKISWKPSVKMTSTLGQDQLVGCWNTWNETSMPRKTSHTVTRPPHWDKTAEPEGCHAKPDCPSRTRPPCRVITGPRLLRWARNLLAAGPRLGEDAFCQSPSK
eukprot:g41503.t1